ncbi:MAG: FAD:protein FMN transferase [Halanaerobiaceae bacterium]
MELRVKGLIYVLIVLLLVGVFFLFRKPEVKYVSRSEFLMDTVVTVKIPESDRSEEIFNAVFTGMEKWDEKLNRMDEDSIIARINNSNKPVKVEEKIFNLIEAGIKYGDLTEGAYDITIAPLIDLWGFGNSEHRIPSDEEIDEVLHVIDYRKIEMEKDENTIFLPSGMAIDLGGIAKGFIVDQACRILQDNGVESAYINAGGDIRVLGRKNREQLWQIGIRKPREENEIFDDYILGLADGSIATSGDYERFFIEDGIRYSHLIDPRTGYQTREMISASIYAPTTLEADVYSTAVFIMGWMDAKEFISSNPDIEGFLVSKDKKWTSSGFKKLMVNK